eukprot:541647-Alexandrium_andersonii.AAC.1
MTAITMHLNATRPRPPTLCMRVRTPAVAPSKALSRRGRACQGAGAPAKFLRPRAPLRTARPAQDAGFK